MTILLVARSARAGGRCELRRRRWVQRLRVARRPVIGTVVLVTYNMYKVRELISLWRYYQGAGAHQPPLRRFIPRRIPNCSCVTPNRRGPPTSTNNKKESTSTYSMYSKIPFCTTVMFSLSPFRGKEMPGARSPQSINISLPLPGGPDFAIRFRHSISPFDFAIIRIRILARVIDGDGGDGAPSFSLHVSLFLFPVKVKNGFLRSFLLFSCCFVCSFSSAFSSSAVKVPLVFGFFSLSFWLPFFKFRFVCVCVCVCYLW